MSGKGLKYDSNFTVNQTRRCSIHRSQKNHCYCNI